MDTVIKKATCKQLRGVCDTVITGSTPEQMAQNAKDHVMDKMSDGDKAHQELAMKMLSFSKAQQKAFYEEFVSSFDSLEEK